MVLGFGLASTVTVAVQIVCAPSLSVTVKVTTCGVPTLEQLKVSVSIVVDTIVAGATAVEPLSISSAVIMAFPVSSRVTIISLQEAIGGF